MNSETIIEYPKNFEELTCRLIMEDKKLRKLKEECLEEELKLNIKNAKMALRELKKIEEGDDSGDEKVMEVESF